MIINLIINLLSLVFGAIFSFLPVVEKLPNILGYDIDTALVNGIGYFNTFAGAFWPLKYVIAGAIVFLTYLGVMMLVRFIIGGHSPK